MGTINIRLLTFTSFRHYGGREITPTAHIVKASLLKEQQGWQKYVCTLLEDGAGFKAGHVIAVSEKDYDVK